MNGTEIRRKRANARIAGRLLCLRAGVDRTRLSNIERGYVQPSESELGRITAALEGLIQARQKVATFAAEVGWPMALA